MIFTGHTVRTALYSLAVVVTVSGCSENQQSIYRESNLSQGTSILTDAKQRLVTNLPYREGPRNGEVRRIPERIICAEPSPDVAQAIAEAIKLSVGADITKAAGGGRELSVDAQRSVAASVAQLGERLATIQLLRDKMYRACEAYANNAVTATGYTLMLARLDKTMVTLLSNEMAAGAFGRSLAHIGATASSGVSPQELKKAEQEAKSAAEDLKAAAALPDADTKKPGAIQDAGKKLDTAMTKLAVLQSVDSQSVGGFSAGAPGSITGHPGTNLLSAASIAKIHQNYIDDDGVEPLFDACITAMDGVRFNPEIVEKIAANFKSAQLNTDGKSEIAPVQQQRRSVKYWIDEVSNARRVQAVNEREIQTLEKLGRRKPDEEVKLKESRETLEKTNKYLAYAEGELKAARERLTQELEAEKNAADKYDKAVADAFLSSGSPFSAFCHRAVFSDKAPFAQLRTSAKRDLRAMEIRGAGQSDGICADLLKLLKDKPDLFSSGNLKAPLSTALAEHCAGGRERVDPSPDAEPVKPAVAKARAAAPAPVAAVAPAPLAAPVKPVEKAP